MICNYTRVYYSGVRWGSDRVSLSCSSCYQPHLPLMVEYQSPQRRNRTWSWCPPVSLCWFILQSDVQEQVECLVEGDNLLCELGNPFKSNQEVQKAADLWIQLELELKLACRASLETLFFLQVQMLIIFQPNEFNLDIREIQTVLQLST